MLSRCNKLLVGILLIITTNLQQYIHIAINTIYIYSNFYLSESSNIIL